MTTHDGREMRFRYALHAAPLPELIARLHRSLEPVAPAEETGGSRRIPPTGQSPRTVNMSDNA